MSDWLLDTEITLVKPDTPLGGQHIGSTNYPVRARHKPTGIACECGSQRSQHLNRKVALKGLEAALLEHNWILA